MNNKRLSFVEESITQLANCLMTDAPPSTANRISGFVMSFYQLREELDQELIVDKLKGEDDVSRMWALTTGSEVDRNLYDSPRLDHGVSKNDVVSWLNLYFGEYTTHELLNVPYFKDVQTKTRAALKEWVDEQEGDTISHGVVRYEYKVWEDKDEKMVANLVITHRHFATYSSKEPLSVDLVLVQGADWFLHPVSHNEYRLVEDMQSLMEGVRWFIEHELNLTWPHFTPTLGTLYPKDSLYRLPSGSWDSDTRQITWVNGFPHATAVYGNGYVKKESTKNIAAMEWIEYNYLLELLATAK